MMRQMLTLAATALVAGCITSPPQSELPPELVGEWRSTGNSNSTFGVGWELDFAPDGSFESLSDDHMEMQ